MDKTTKEDVNEETQSEEKYRLFASMSFMIVVIIIGVPMWWKTTEVYRVSLPSTNILSLSEKPTKISQKIGIFSFNTNRSQLLVEELIEMFHENELWDLNFQQILPSVKTANVKTPAGLEAMLVKVFPLDAGDFMFIEWPKLQEQVLLTTERTALIRSDTSASKLKSVLNVVVLQTSRIKQILNTDQRFAPKTEAPQEEYDVVISVLNPRPEIMDVVWNVQMATETYVRPFLNEVSHISNYTVKTQWNYQVEFETEWKQIRDGTKIGRHYALQESSLPHIITSIEKHLGMGIMDKSTINLVVYVPPCDIAPVHIYNRRGELATRNNVDSFISPKWGSIIIANPSMEVCLDSHSTIAMSTTRMYVNTNDVMQIMLDHLHKLLDIKVEYNLEGVKSVALEQIAPRRWEYEAYIRRSAVTHIVTATNTLQSLIKLLDNISYIVINDVVGAAINEAYDQILLAKEALAQNQLLQASNYAKRAFIASEQAFFDASLLAQLYFPDEQKYAIYIPLFLPIMVPVITSFTMTRKLLMKLRNSSKTKTD